MDGVELSGRRGERIEGARLLNAPKWRRLLIVPPLMVHVGIVLTVGWIFSHLEFKLLLLYTLGFVYLIAIEKEQMRKIETRIRSEVRRSTDRQRLLSDVESARWLNYVLESVWPIFLERFVSKHIFMRVVPWFLNEYKPWTAKTVLLKSLDLGRSPPVFTRFRAGGHPTNGDHLVLEMTMSFTAARDMAASMAVQMKKRVGLGIWTSFHISDLQVEGHVKVGIRFVRGWPVLGRLRICFSHAPVFRMVAKPIFSHGVDVTDLPGVAAWLHKTIIDALEQSVVEPNLLVVDVEQLVGDLMSAQASLYGGRAASPRRNWFSAGKRTVATLLVEILEAEMLKPCDVGGRADPYVRIVLGSTEHRTSSVKRKTLDPAWHEQFRLPIVSWAVPNFLLLRVRDEDLFVDDEMGYKEVHINDLKPGQRHDMWLALDGVETGRLHVALMIEDSPPVDDEEGSAQHRQSSIPPSELGVEADSVHVGRNLGDFVQSDLEETPVKSEIQTVDVEAGEPGCVSILHPGKAVVDEGYSPERFAHREKSGRDVRELERELDKPAFQVEKIDFAELGLASLPSKKKSRSLRNLLGGRSNREQKTELPNDISEGKTRANELMLVGDMGTQVHLKLEMDDQEIENLEAFGPPNNITLVPESSDQNGEDQIKLKRATVKTMGRGMLKQASKVAHSIGGVIKKVHRNPDLPRREP